MTLQLIRQGDVSRRLHPTLNAYLLGRRITCMTVSAIIDAIDSACREKRQIVIANFNVHSFNLSFHLPWFYNFLKSADITHCDGLGILYALRFMGYKLPLAYRASYTLLMPELLEYCNRNHLSIFLLGAKPHYLDLALDKLRQDYPHIDVQGHHGYFRISDASDNQEIIRQINRMRPYILLVGMGMPIQEWWVQAHRSQLEANTILMGGAVIDRLAGIVPDCPAWLSNMGLEWLFRLIREPKRLSTRYLLGNPAFLLQVMLAKHIGTVHYSDIDVVDQQPIEA
jgi:N-acetylglucosaminyldiphosphoundecaprenol N-acetyl-beta-D-mannosaminyltransferase